ncbi:MAG: Spy/CpxP family protein refolding chaperone [Burkholderiaceae bacterium]
MKRFSIKRLLVGLAGAALLAGGLAACSHYRGGGEWNETRAVEMRARIVGRISDKLDLDAGQKQKLDALADEIAAARKAVRGGDAAADPRAEFRALIAGERFDRAGAQQLFERKTAAVQAEGPKVMTALADFYDSLNADQQRKVRERLEKGHGRWGPFGGA